MLEDTSTTVAALAGRRADADGDKPPRFPARNLGLVEERVAAFFRREGVGRIVCAAACGADLVALRVADDLCIPALIVLPFSRGTFRRVSVADRPGQWVKLYDRLVEAAERRGDLITLDLAEENKTAFSVGNARIVYEADRIPSGRRLAIAIWEGSTRGDGDATADLLTEALRRGFETASIMTV